jgi:hypothetical protein
LIFAVRRCLFGQRLASYVRFSETCRVEQLLWRMDQSIKDTTEWLASVVRGYFKYLAVPGNEQRIWAFRNDVLRHCFGRFGAAVRIRSPRSGHN